MTRVPVGHLGAAAVALAALTAFVPPAGAQEVCATCHAAVASAFAETRHGRYAASGRAAEPVNCSSCHVGAAEHAASPMQRRPLSPATGPAAEVNAACLSCHERGAQAHWEGSAHERAGTRCTACHSVHEQHPAASARGVTASGAGATTQRCLTCHRGMRASLNARSTHPLRDGQMECSSCHDPHGGTGEHLLKQASVNDLCYTCHQDQRGPFLWEHAPVREDCLSCHRAHSSNYPSMLQARTTQLCQSCHQQGRHQTIPGVPRSIWLDNKACLNCHSRIHGSNHPSGPLFQR